jgi:endonuclease/exonuclease/phosphatase (EEP) superfamily protein YafD
MPPGSKAQKEHLAAMGALRLQEGGSGPSVSTHETLARRTLELRTARAAQESAEIALEQIGEQLHTEQDHSKDLYHALCMQRQKATRAKAAKAISEANTAEAQSSLEKLEDQFQQLTLKNKQLELTMTKLVENWAGEKKIAQETLQDCQRKSEAW